MIHFSFSTAFSVFLILPLQNKMPFKGRHLYAFDACCFICSHSALKTAINTMIHKLPQDAWEQTVKDRLVLPILRSLSLLDPLRRMPMQWLEKPPALCPYDNKDRVTGLFWELCHMVERGPGQYTKNYFLTMHTLSLNITHIIIFNHGVSPEEYWALREQIYILDGFDGVVTEIKDVVSRGGRGAPIRMNISAEYIHRCGAVDYALFMIEKMHGLVHHNEKSVQALDDLKNALVAIQGNEKAKLHSLRMALHPRAKGVGIGMLGADLLQLCVEKSRRKPIVLWEDVLDEWLTPLMMQRSEQ
jgi:hypothetical protein